MPWFSGGRSNSSPALPGPPSTQRVGRRGRVESCMSWAFPRFLLIPPPWGWPTLSDCSPADSAGCGSKGRTVGPAWALPPHGLWKAVSLLHGLTCVVPPPPTPGSTWQSCCRTSEARRVHVLHGGEVQAVMSASPAHPHPALSKGRLLSCPLGSPPPHPPTPHFQALRGPLAHQDRNSQLVGRRQPRCSVIPVGPGGSG